VTMEVLACGQGEPVVLIHGFTASKEAWFFNMDALGASFRVLAVDLPGYGQSSKVVEDHCLAFYAGWIQRLLAQQKLGAAHVVGNSMGGAVAMELALQAPQLVRKVALVDPLGFGTEVAPGILERLANSSTRDEVQALMAVAVHDPAVVLPAAVERSYAYRQQPGVPALLKRVAAQFSDGTRNLVDYSGRLKDLKMPVLVVWGKDDRLLPVANAANVKALPNGSLKLFDQCGHLPQLEKAAEFNALLTEFLLERE
ncbi:MAG TPA: alpha/beta fold hydrolase, partial [bacterium]|nr:alpha/beta fold hydrolase [bacterium]